MSKYTTQVRFICENAAGLSESVGADDVEDVLDASWEAVVGTDFPIFDEDYRETLCKKILRHYYTREIGLETVGLWRLKLNTKLNEIMPYYNKLYESETLKFNPFYNFKTERQYTGSATGKASNSGNTQNLYSDTPQGDVTGILSNSKKYLTDARVINDSNSSNSRNDNQFFETVVGNTGNSNYSQMLKDFRKTFLNIDMDIINELNELFMGLWE